MGRIKNLDRSLAVLALSGISLAGLLTGAAAMGADVPTCTSKVIIGGPALTDCVNNGGCDWYPVYFLDDTCDNNFTGINPLKTCGLLSNFIITYKSYTDGECVGGHCEQGDLDFSGSWIQMRYLNPVQCGSEN